MLKSMRHAIHRRTQILMRQDALVHMNSDMGHGLYILLCEG